MLLIKSDDLPPTRTVLSAEMANVARRRIVRLHYIVVMRKSVALVLVLALSSWREVESLATPASAHAPKSASSSRTSRRSALTRILLENSIIFGGTFLFTPAKSQARNLPQSTGADLEKTGTVEALIPIVRIRQALDGPAADLPYTIPREEQAFKRLFDEYSDPISYKQKFLDQNAFLVYYTRGFDGPNRPGIEEDLPGKQTLQYGARNEAWISWEELQAELQFAQNNPDESNDANLYLRKLIAAVDAYLQLAPPEDVQQAMKNSK